MNHPDFWLTASLACNFLLVLVAVGSSLFLIRRLDQLVRARTAAEQRLIQLAFDLHKVDQRLAQLEARGAGGKPFSPIERTKASAASLIAVPDVSYQGGGDGVDEDAASLARKHGDVWALVESGRELAEIAATTGRPIGQVELIAGLHRQYHSSRAAGDHAPVT